MFRVQSPAVDDVLASSITIDAEALANLLDALGTEGTLRIDVGDLSLSASLVLGELADDGSSHAKLRLAGAELAKNFGDGHSLDAAAEDGIEGLGAGGDATDFAADVAKFGGGNKVVGRRLMSMSIPGDLQQ